MMDNGLKPLIRCLPVAEWPEKDRSAWIEACRPGDPFDDPNPASQLRPDSQKKIQKGYGRWLCFLANRGWLDPDLSAAERITKQRLKAYFQELQSVGNADDTVIGRFSELALMTSYLCPGYDTSLIRRPGSISIYAALPKERRPKYAPDSNLMFNLAIDMMDVADLSDPRQLVDYRDGLLLAILASRARRLRAMASLRSGHEVVRRSDSYRIELTPDLVKTKKFDLFSLPDDLTPYVDRYLRSVRPALLAGRFTDAFWISRRHGPLSEKSVQERVFARTKQWFGKGFGPHRFRHALVTTASLKASDFSHLGAAALGIHRSVAERHYNLAYQVGATGKYGSFLDAKRSALKRGR